MTNGRGRSWMVALAALTVTLLAAQGVAQTNTEPVAPPAPAAGGDAPGHFGSGMSLSETMHAGGKLMWVTAGLSVLALALIVYFFYVLRVSQTAPPSLHRDLVEKIRSGDMKTARWLCEQKPSPLAAVALVAIDCASTRQQVDPSFLKDLVEGEGSRQAEDIQGQTVYLLDVAVIAPMVGLLGTVFGMLRAFSAVAHEVASAKPVVLAEGVGIAMLNTAFGLIVAIPAMAFYAYFRRLSSKQTMLLEKAASDVVASILNRKESPESFVEVRTPTRGV
jgi:biopolymer transport protein ExbB